MCVHTYNQMRRKTTNAYQIASQHCLGEGREEGARGGGGGGAQTYGVYESI